VVRGIGRRDGLRKAGELRLPFGPLISLARSAIVVWLLSSLPAKEATGDALRIAAAVAVYAVPLSAIARFQSNLPSRRRPFRNQAVSDRIKD